MNGTFTTLQGLRDLFPFMAFLSLAPLPGQAEDYAYVTNNGAITITKYLGAAGDLTVPDTITGLPVASIGHNAFDGCGNVTGVTIPNSITSLGDSAFFGCTNLASVRFGNNFTNIGLGAFNGCHRLTSVTIPNSVRILGDWAFCFCTGLTSVNVGDNVASIGPFTFAECTSLTSLKLGKSVTKIEESAFSGCTSLTSVTIPNGVTTIDGYAFSACSNLACITIPNSVTSIGAYAFNSCTRLRGVHFWGSPPACGYEPFYQDTNFVFCLPGTRGWDSTFAGRPTAPWILPQPVILTLPPDFGVQANSFGFRVSWATNATVAIDACTSLNAESWTPVATNTLLDGWTYFADPDWANHPARFYRIRSP